MPSRYFAIRQRAGRRSGVRVCAARRLAIGGVLVALLGGADAPSPYPPHTLLLLVASWCAPCRDELARLDTIVAAAAPRTVRVVPTDAGRATAAMLRDVEPARIWRSARAIEALSHQIGGLPYSVMTDAAGRPCATHARPLDAAAVRTLRARCDGG